MSKVSPETYPYKRKKRDKYKSKKIKYFYLFSVVFIITLLSLLYLVKSYFPETDVTIGNNESFTLTETNQEEKPVDERLKWIQMEDEITTGPVQEQNKEEFNNFYDDFNEGYASSDISSDRIIISQEKDKIADKKSSNSDTLKSKKEAPVPKIVVPKPLPSITKVYLGNFINIEDAVKMQNKIAYDEPTIIPFVKSIDNHYIVQVGSFSDSERASDLMIKLREKGYSPKVLYEN